MFSKRLSGSLFALASVKAAKPPKAAAPAKP